MKIGLLVVFNHRFDANIEFLRGYYSPRFSQVIFLVPFADDLEKKCNDVISVHYASHLFQGFFGEARERISKLACDAYVVVGDDLLLNPTLNESNLHSRIGIAAEEAYIKNLRSLYDSPLAWSRGRTTFRALFADSLESTRLLPQAKEAFAKAAEYPVPHRPLGTRNFRGASVRSSIASVATAAGWIASGDHSRRLFAPGCAEVPYPAYYGYSDFLIIPGPSWPAFADRCLTTAAMQMFVEAAIPLALVLSCDRVETELEYGESFETTNPKRRRRMRGIEFHWEPGSREAFEQKYGSNLDTLLATFPEDVIYFHPVKLSIWKQTGDLPGATKSLS